MDNRFEITHIIQYIEFQSADLVSKNKEMNSNKVILEECDDQSSQDFQELREQISLSNAELIDLVSETDIFLTKIKQLNDTGLKYIQSQQFKEALIYLQQAEKILQYAASCGKTIDRSLIVATLQNQACTYQKLWELEKSSNYMEAIIFNMNAYLEHPPPIMNGLLSNPSSMQFINLSNLVAKRIQISLYYLQYSALSSQLDKHQVALGSALNALATLKKVCEECYNYEKQKKITEEDDDIGSKILLKQLSNVKEEVSIEKYDRYLTTAKKILKKFKNKSNTHQPDFQEFLEFVIGDVMQVSMIKMETLNQEPTLNKQIQFNQKIYKAIYISIAFFAIATQLRLISLQSYPENEKKNSKEFKKSQLYHLNAIIIAAKFIPCQTKYISHILKSFTAHYNIDLLNNCEDSQETNESQMENGTMVGTPIKQKVNLNHLQMSPSPIKNQKQDHKQPAQETKLKIPMLHMKKKKKGKSQQKIEKSQFKTIIKPNSQYRGKGKLTQVTSRQKIKTAKQFDAGTQRKKSKSQKKSKMKSLSRSKSKKDQSKQFLKNRSKEKVYKKAKKLKEQYFQHPEEKKKQKNKVILSPVPCYSPKPTTMLIKSPRPNKNL